MKINTKFRVFFACYINKFTFAISSVRKNCRHATTPDCPDITTTMRKWKEVGEKPLKVWSSEIARFLDPGGINAVYFLGGDEVLFGRRKFVHF